MPASLITERTCCRSCSVRQRPAFLLISDGDISDSFSKSEEEAVAGDRHSESLASLATQNKTIKTPRHLRHRHRQKLKLIKMNNNAYYHHSPPPKTLLFLLLLLISTLFLFLLSALPAVGETAAAANTGQMPDHVRVAVITDNSTSAQSYAAKQAAFIESAAKLYSFMDKSLILDQTRLIVSTIRLPARDALASTKILCREIQSTSNIIALIVGDVGSALMSFIVGLANEAEIPLLDLTIDYGRFMISPTRYGPTKLMAAPTFEPGFVVYMRPSSALHLTTAIEDLMAAYKWERMLMLYDKPESLTQMQKLLGDVGIDGVPSEKAVFRLNNSNLFEVTQSIKFRWPNVVVALDEAMTAKFLRVALRTGILSSGYSYILTNPNAHFISMEDFAQNFPNVTLLRFIVDNDMTRTVLENARRFEEVQSNKYRVIVPDDSLNFDDIPKILMFNREIPITLSAALLLDALTLVRRALASVFSPDLMGPTTTSKNAANNFVFKQISGVTCRSSQSRATVPLQTPYGRTILKALVSASASFDGITGTVAFNPRTNFRDVADMEVLGLGGIGLQRIGGWQSDAAVLRETAMARIVEQLKFNSDARHSEDTSPTPVIPAKSARELRLHLDDDAIYMLKRATVLTNRTLVSTTIKKKTLIVTTLLEAPYVMIRKDKSKHSPNSRSAVEHNYEGYCVDLLDEIAAMTGFTYRIHLVGDGAYGSPNRKTGRWTGMVGEVIEGKADIAVAPLTITYAREQVVDFTKPFLNLGISILYLQPFKEKPSLFSFMQPLAGEIWGYVVLSYVIVTFIFYAVGRFSPYEWHSSGYNIPANDGETTAPISPNNAQRYRYPFDIQHHVNIFTLANSSWFTAGTLMQQGSDVNPRALSTRIVGGAWWFFSLIIISSYTANLAAFLTVETVFSPFESAEELAKQNKIQYGAVKGGSTENFFRESKIDTYRTMWASMQNRDVFVKNNSEGIARVRNENPNYAYLMESVSLEYILQSPIDNKNCDLRQVGGLLDSKGYGIATARESPYRDVLSMAILQLQENDRLQLLYNKWWKSTGTCAQQENKPKVLGPENIGGIFAILLIGLAISLFSLAAEVLWYAQQHNPHDGRSYWRRLFDNFRLIATFRSKLPRPISESQIRKNHQHSSSRKSTSARSASAASTVIQELTSPVPEVLLPLNPMRLSSPASSLTSKHRRSRSFHGETTLDNNFLPPHREDEPYYVNQPRSPQRLPPDLPPRPPLNVFESGDEEFSQQLLRSGGVIDNLTPKSRANAIALLENLSLQQRQQQQSHEELSPSRAMKRGGGNNRPPNLARQRRYDGGTNNSSGQRFPVVSFQTSLPAGNTEDDDDSQQETGAYSYHPTNNNNNRRQPGGGQRRTLKDNDEV